MDKKEQILHYHRIDGLSQREIARRVGVCRKTKITGTVPLIIFSAKVLVN